MWPSQNSAWVPSSLCPLSAHILAYRGQAGSGPAANHNAYQVTSGKMCSPYASGGQATTPCCPQPNSVLKETRWCESGCGHTVPALSAQVGSSAWMSFLSISLTSTVRALRLHPLAPQCLFGEKAGWVPSTMDDVGHHAFWNLLLACLSYVLDRVICFSCVCVLASV